MPRVANGSADDSLGEDLLPSAYSPSRTRAGRQTFIELILDIQFFEHDSGLNQIFLDVMMDTLINASNQSGTEIVWPFKGKDYSQLSRDTRDKCPVGLLHPWRIG